MLKIRHVLKIFVWELIINNQALYWPDNPHEYLFYCWKGLLDRNCVAVTLAAGSKTDNF